MAFVKASNNIQLLPTTTIGEIKKYIKDNKYDLTTASLIYGENQVPPILFRIDTYDNSTLADQNIIDAKLIVELDLTQSHEFKFPDIDPSIPYTVQKTEVCIDGGPSATQIYKHFKTYDEMVNNAVELAESMKNEQMCWFDGKVNQNGRSYFSYTISYSDRDSSSEGVYYMVTQEEIDYLDSYINTTLEGVYNEAG